MPAMPGQLVHHRQTAAAKQQLDGDRRAREAVPVDVQEDAAGGSNPVTVGTAGIAGYTFRIQSQ
jgi:hypothetical protein